MVIWHIHSMLWHFPIFELKLYSMVHVHGNLCSRVCKYIYLHPSRKYCYIHVSTMLPFAFLSYPEWHKCNSVFEEACRADSTIATQVLQQHLNSEESKWVFVCFTCVCVNMCKHLAYGYMKSLPYVHIYCFFESKFVVLSGCFFK